MAERTGRHKGTSLLEHSAASSSQGRAKRHGMSVRRGHQKWKIGVELAVFIKRSNLCTCVLFIDMHYMHEICLYLSVPFNVCDRLTNSQCNSRSVSVINVHLLFAISQLTNSL